LSKKPLNVEISVTIIYPYPDNTSKDLENYGCKMIYNRFIVLNHYNNIFIKIIRRIFSEIVLSLIYIRLMWKEKFNLSLVNTELYSFSLLFLNLICPIYVVVHSLSFKNSGFFTKVVFFFQKKIVKKYLAVSFAVKNALRDFNISRNVFVTYNGVPTPLIQQKKISRPFKIISVIHPVPHKGAHLLIDVLTDLSKFKMDFEWTLIGWDIKSGDRNYADDIIRLI
jgi:glycosyltransferase involved in cell wall biosynthesis